MLCVSVCLGMSRYYNVIILYNMLLILQIIIFENFKVKFLVSDHQILILKDIF